MNKKYQTRYFPKFYDDLERITYYIKTELKNIIAANKFLDEIEKEIEKRRYNPENYEKYILHGIIYYRIYVKNYIIFYTVKGNVMEMRRVLYSKRNFKKLI